MTARDRELILSRPLSDAETEALIGWTAELAAMLSFEAALAHAEAEHKLIPRAAAEAISEAIAGFQPDINAFNLAIERDGVPVPELVRQIRLAVGSPHADYVHFGATSQDVIDTSMVLRISQCLKILEARLIDIFDALNALDTRFGKYAIMAYTRMQPAIPITVSDRIASWRGPLERHLSHLTEVRRSGLVIQFGGAAGTLDKLGHAATVVRATLAAKLGLNDAPQWHSQRDRIAELGNWLAQVSGSLGKFGQDVALMARDGDEISLAGGGASSAMPHKQNPIDAELLVALGRFNAVQISALHQSMLHEQERSGAAWALEWMVLPQMLIATGASTRLASRLIGKIDQLGR